MCIIYTYTVLTSCSGASLLHTILWCCCPGRLIGFEVDCAVNICPPTPGWPGMPTLAGACPDGSIRAMVHVWPLCVIILAYCSANSAAATAAWYLIDLLIPCAGTDGGLPTSSLTVCIARWWVSSTDIGCNSSRYFHVLKSRLP